MVDVKYQKYCQNLSFNPAPVAVMHIDLNSCFASVEQQANPHLRGRPVAVAAYSSPGGCIIAPSVEAKRLGIKVGMRVKDGKLICPDLFVLEPDPNKYRSVHLNLRRLVSEYTPDFSAKSIDEFVLDFKLCPGQLAKGVKQTAVEIKKRIKKEIGDWLSVSIGIATNRFLAKLAAGLHKPDGLDVIDNSNYLSVYQALELTDIPGIKTKNAIRLNNAGIFSVVDFYHSPVWRLKAAFASINGYYWYLRLRGWEIDDVEFNRSSFGNSYALPEPLTAVGQLSPILSKLVEKMGFRLRRAGFKAGGVHVGIIYSDWDFWHKGISLTEAVFDSRDIYKKALQLLMASPCKKPVRELAVSVFNLEKKSVLQLDMFDDLSKKERLVESVDAVNGRWGNFVLTPARMILNNQGAVPDRISFGGVKELEEIVLGG